MLTEAVPMDPVAMLRQCGALLEGGSFRLSSGKVSSYYFDSKPFTLNPEGSHLVGTYFFERLISSDAQAVGGMALGAIPIVQAVTLISHLKNHPIPGFYVRDEAKTHGTQKLIEGNLPEDDSIPVAIIDDVVTEGGSILKAITAVEAHGNPISDVMCVLDRDEGGRENLRSRGYELQAMFTVSSDEHGVVDIRFNP